ncbi:hypothetical protein N9J72_00705 [Candidatus Gracilibacteria bacterium]|nr:hypothetical protein [Candidatus Gracilibacteria bacterium]
MLIFRVIKRIFWKKSLDKKSCKKYTCFLDKLENKTPKIQIIEYDKIYHHILKDLGYTGSFGEILKRNPKEITNIDTVWSLHKLRNSLVHELGEKNADFLTKSAREYKGAVKLFLKEVSK